MRFIEWLNKKKIGVFEQNQRILMRLAYNEALENAAQAVEKWDEAAEIIRSYKDKEYDVIS